MATSRLQTNARTRTFSGRCVVAEVCIAICQNSIYGLTLCYSGTFGVNTRVWLKTYPALKAVNTATGTVVCKDKVSYGNMVSTLMDLQKPLRDAGYTVR
jgi:hypothetical protein